MAWLLIGADSLPVGVPVDEEPVPASGQKAVIVPIGYPDSIAWSAEEDSFVTTEPRLSPHDALVALLVGQGVISAEQAAALPREMP